MSEDNDISATIIRDAIEANIPIDDNIVKLAKKYEQDKKKTFGYKLNAALSAWAEGKVIPAILAILTASLAALSAWIGKILGFFG